MKISVLMGTKSKYLICGKCSSVSNSSHDCDQTTEQGNKMLIINPHNM